MSGLLNIELVAINIANSLTKKDIAASIKYLTSEAAISEARIVNTTQQTQRDIIEIVSKLRPSDLAKNRLKTLTNDVNQLLGVMVSDNKLLTERIITANILSGKMKAALSNKPSSIDSLKLTQQDRLKIAELTNQSVANIKHGADLTFSSFNTLLRNASSKANVNFGNEVVNDDNDKIKQEPVSIQYYGEPVIKKRITSNLKQENITQDELNKIKQNPSIYASEISKQNLSSIISMRNEYNKLKSESNNTVKQKDVESNAEKVSNNLIQNLNKNGLYAFMDKGGKRWTLETYCVMLARTTSTQSQNVGELFSDEEHDLYYVVPHSGSCPICKKYEGRIYSRSGKDKRYPPLASIFAKVDKFGTDDLGNTYLSIHPNCRHKIIRYDKK